MHEKIRSRRITQRDVAKAASVSQALVSQVLNDAASVDMSSEHQRRVLETAQKLGYKKRSKGATEGEKRALAYIHPLVTRGHHQEEWIYRSYEDFYNRKRTLLEEAAQAAGFVLMSRAVTKGDASLTQWLSEWEIQGVFWHCKDPGLGHWVRQRLPMVQFDRSLLGGTDIVMSNTFQTIEIAMKHLIANGHQRIGFISRTLPGDRHSRLPQAAYLDFVKDAGLPCLDYTPALSGENWMDKAAELFRSPSAETPTALVLPDHFALLLQKRLLQEGLTLPDDLSMVGIDNISVCDFSTPALTSVDAVSSEAALEAVALMKTRLQNPDRVCRKVEISPRLIERKSVKTLTPTPVNFEEPLVTTL